MSKFSENIPPHSSDNPDLLKRFEHDAVYAGHPDFVHRVSDEKQTAQVLEFCFHKKIPVTFCGSQTSMTGASVADSGLVVVLTKKSRILEIDKDPKTKKPFVITEPGVILGDLKRAVLDCGYFYPPDPTSFNEAQVGATIATNATGSETFRFGPTRWHVRELEILTAQGKTKTLTRTKPLKREPVKNHAGYNLWGEEIDEIIGSEGTLTLITKIKLDLLENINSGRFLLILPFQKFSNCLEAVVKIIDSEQNPRAIELIGPGAGNYFSICEKCPKELKNSELFLYVSDDYKDEPDFEKKLSKWFSFLEKLYGDLNEKETIEKIFLADTAEKREAIRECRHYIPSKVNEEFFPYVKTGGGKIGTDWWVPKNHLMKMILDTQMQAENLGIPYLVFGHIGNGHPHWDFLCKTKADYDQAFSFVKNQCRQAVIYGGGVAGEHGIGKIKKEILKIQHGPEILKKMYALKEKWDPHWILGQGNILDRF